MDKAKAARMPLSRRKVLAGSAGAAGALITAPGVLAQATSTLVGASDGAVHLPAREVPPPGSISEPARAYLRAGANRPIEARPPGSDKDGWRRMIAEHDGAMLRRVGGGDVDLPGLSVEHRVMGGVTVYVVTKPGSPPAARKPLLWLHGGGWTSLAGKLVRLFGQVAAQQYGGTVYAADYRTPPDHPFPAPLDDCLAVYRAMLALHKPGEILVSGGSAGGNLAAALMLKARDAGLPRPRALVLENPIVDLNCTGDTMTTNQLLDVQLKVWRKDENVVVYADGASLDDPYLSPLKGDLSRGFPPTYLRCGTRDLFLSDTVRFHAALRKAGVEADLYIGEGMPHGGFGGQTPEDADALADMHRWLAKHW